MGKKYCSIETHREIAQKLDQIESELRELEVFTKPYMTRHDQECITRFMRYYLRDFRYRVDCLLFRGHGRCRGPEPITTEELQGIYKSDFNWMFMEGKRCLMQ